MILWYPFLAPSRQLLTTFYPGTYLTFKTSLRKYNIARIDHVIVFCYSEDRTTIPPCYPLGRLTWNRKRNSCRIYAQCTDKNMRNQISRTGKGKKNPTHLDLPKGERKETRQIGYIFSEWAFFFKFITKLFGHLSCFSLYFHGQTKLFPFIENVSVTKRILYRKLK